MWELNKKRRLMEFNGGFIRPSKPVKSFESLSAKFRRRYSGKAKGYYSIKYDGRYTAIYKVEEDVKFFTSNGDEFYIESVANDIRKANKGLNFYLECEFIGATNGKLGMRRHTGLTTTLTTEFRKKESTPETVKACEDVKFMVFNCLSFYDTFDTLSPVDYRSLSWFGLMSLASKIQSTPQCEMIPQTYGTYVEAEREADLAVANGYEGLVWVFEGSRHFPGQRSKSKIKIKPLKTATLKVLGYTPGEKSYTGLVGSLNCVDAFGNHVSVCSGLSMYNRSIASYNKTFKDMYLEIHYDSIADTYLTSRIKTKPTLENQAKLAKNFKNSKDVFST